MGYYLKGRCRTHASVNNNINMLVFRMKIRTLNEFPCFYVQCTFFCDCKIVIVWIFKTIKHK